MPAINPRKDREDAPKNKMYQTLAVAVKPIFRIILREMRNWGGSLFIAGNRIRFSSACGELNDA